MTDNNDIGLSCLDEEGLIAYSHCTGLGPGPGQVQRIGLAQKETIGQVPFPVSEQCEHFGITSH